jgi:predicted outer membrane protein
MRFEKYIRRGTIIFFATAVFSCDIRDTSVQPDRVVQKEVQSKAIGSRENDATFVLETADELSLEIQLAQLAVKNSLNPDVKELAIQVMTDNNVAISELREIIFRNNLSPLELPGNRHKKQIKFFARKNGIEFDKAFSAFMVKRYPGLLKSFENIATEGANEELKNWAAGKINGLKRQLAIAELLGTKRTANHSEGDAESVIE